MRRSRSLLLTALATAVGLLVPATGAVAQSAERHTLSGDDVEIYHVVGTLRVVAGTGRDVTVEVTRRGRDAGETAIEQGVVSGRETLRIYPRSARIVYPALRGRGVVRADLLRDGTFPGDPENGHFFGSSSPSRSRLHTLEIRRDGQGAESWADVVVAVPAGRRVALHLVAGEAAVRDVDARLELDVYQAGVITERTRGTLRVDAGSGAVSVADAQGDLELDTGSGNVALSRVRGASLRVDAGSGALRGSDVDADVVDLDLGSGNAELQRVRSRALRVDGGSGNVDVGLLEGVEDVKLDVGSGSVTLRVPERFGATLSVESGSGGIDSELPIADSRREQGQLTGRIGDGRARIVIETGSGSVRLRRG